MSIVRDPVRDAVRNVVRGVVRAVSEVQRYFTTLDSAGAQYDAFTSDVVLTGDFEIEVTAVTTNLSSQAVLGDKDTDTDLFYTDSNALRFRLDGSAFFNLGSATISDGKLHTIGAARAASTITGYADGVPLSAPATSTNTFTINAAGQRFGGLFFDGIIANIKIWKDGDRNTGTLIVDAKKDSDGSSNVIVNDADPSNPLNRINQTSTDAELFTQVSDGWIGEELWSIGKLVASSEGAFAVIDGGSDSIMTAGNLYSWSVDAANLTTGSAVLQLGSADSGAITDDGEVSGSVAADASLVRLINLSTPVNSGANFNISVKRLLEVAL